MVGIKKNMHKLNKLQKQNNSQIKELIKKLKNNIS